MNQKKAEFVYDIFCIQHFWEGHGKISTKTWFIQEGAICPEMLIQQPVEFPTAVTHEPLTFRSHLIDHRKAESIAYRNGIQDIQSSGQSET
jgi:hypothetical protein